MKIAPGVELPDSALHYHLVEYGKTRVGKTYTIKGMVEKLMDLGRRVCICDPTSAYWGLKYPGDGPDAKGYPFTIFGGKRADVPINDRAAGPLAALLMGGANVPAIIDMQQMKVTERIRFFTVFAEEMLRLADPSRPIHLVIDEAHLFAPKELPRWAGSKRDDEDHANPVQMLSNTLALATGGGMQGIRLMVASQRPAMLHNTLASQCETMIAMKVIHPSDRSAVEDWVKGAGDKAKGREVIDSLASLKRGEGWVWAPDHGVLVRTTFPKIRSFDSSRTPDDGQVAAPPKKMTPVDLTAINAAMTEAVHEAEANDPKLLRARIQKLEQEAKKAGTGKSAAAVVTKAAPVDTAPIIAKAQADTRRELKRAFTPIVKSLSDSAARLARMSATLTAEQETLANSLTSFTTLMEAQPAAPVPSLNGHAVSHPTPRIMPAVIPAKYSKPAASPAEGLDGPQQAILDTVLMLEARGIPAGKDCVARWMGIHPNGGRYGTNLGYLRENGYLEPKSFILTEQGRAAAHPQDDDLNAALAALPDDPTRAIVQVLIEAGNPLSKDDLAEMLGIHPNGGRFGTNLGWLRTMGLITERGPISVTPGLYGRART